MDSFTSTIYTLADQVDLAVYYEADTVRYSPDYLKRVGMSLDFFVQFFSGCPSIGFMADGQPIGGVIYDRDRTGEIHFAVLLAHHGRWHCLWQPALDWVYSQQDPVCASVERFNEKCIRFMDRQGYLRLETTDTTIKYMMSSNLAVLGQNQSKGSTILKFV